MNDPQTPSLEDIQALAERCVTHVRGRFGFELDFTPETLGVVDTFIGEVVKEEGAGAELAPGDSRRGNLVHLLAPTLGAYFGEVLCRACHGRWRLRSAEPTAWLIELEEVPLRLLPVALAAEAITAADLPAAGGALSTEPRESQALEERLAAVPPFTESEYYALTTRLEAVQIAEDYLKQRLAAREDPPPAVYTEADYDHLFDSN